MDPTHRGRRPRCCSRSPCLRSWRRGRCWRRAARLSSAGASRWPSNLGIVVVDALVVRLAGSGGGRRRLALCRRPRHRAVPSTQPAALGRGAARVSHPRPCHLRPARRVPSCAVAVAAAPHAPRRPRHRRDHRVPLSSVRDSDLAASRSPSVLAFGIPPVAVFIFEVVLNATSLFNHSNVAMPALARSRRAARAGDARHAPRASFDRARGDRQQFRLQPAVVGSPVRDLPARAAGRPRRHDHRPAGLPRPARAAARPDADPAVPADGGDGTGNRAG